MRLSMLTCLAAALLAAAPAAAAVVGSFEFDNSLANGAASGPSSIAFVDGAGAATTPVYQAGGTGTGIAFAQGFGFVTGAYATASTFSVETYFSFANVDGYRRILDFKDRTSDTGFYVLNSALNFFNVTTGTPGAFTPNTLAHVVFTRDVGSAQVNGYVNGALAITFGDTGSLGTILNDLNAFRDDNAVGGEQSAGFVDFIRVYDTALTQGEVTALYARVSAVPEPATWAMMVGGFGLVGGSARVRVRRRLRAA